MGFFSGNNAPFFAAAAAASASAAAAAVMSGSSNRAAFVAVVAAGVAAAAAAASRGSSSKRGGTLDASTIKSEEDLKQLLERDGVDTSLFGVDKAKDIGALLKEIREGSAKLEIAPSGRIQRTVEPAFVLVCFGDLVLVEKLQILEDGRERARNMVLAEKMEPGDRDALHTALRGIEEEMQVPQSELGKPGLTRFCEDAYCVMVEEMESKSFPGVPCCYRNHYIQIELLEASLPLFKKLGLPGGEEFWTEETTKKGTKKMNWTWISKEKAREMKVKGLLTDETPGVLDPKSKKCP